MHNDYKIRLNAPSDKLTDVVLEEADPDTWPSAAKPPDKHTKQERGDRHWCKNNAAALLTLLVKVRLLIGMLTHGGTPVRIGKLVGKLTSQGREDWQPSDSDHEVAVDDCPSYIQMQTAFQTSGAAAPNGTTELLWICKINKVNLKYLGLWLCGFKSCPGCQRTKILNNQSNK